jgi:dTMP kinase
MDAPLLAIEGVDGAGKSTVTALLVELLRERGHAVATYDFPVYDAPQFGPLIARFLRGGFGPMNQSEPWFVGMLFAGNRAELAPSLRADAAAGRVVVSDRFSYSNVAFQSAKLGPDEDRDAFADWLAHLEFEAFGVPRPAVSFWLHVPLALRPGVAAERGDREYLDGGVDVHEADESLQLRVHEAYAYLAATRPDVETIECAPGGVLLPPAAVAEALWDRMAALDVLPPPR